ncbi:F-box/kelch-repeat protein [Trifolium repens]|nr:F-box/kelch-repeat protein [Trifolium repens]
MASTSRNEKKISGANNNNYLPEGIVFSILSKLPLKSLKRFSCVSESWAHLFENPIFFTMFHNNLVSKSHSLYNDDDDDVHFVLNQYVDSFRWDFYLLYGEMFENKHKLDLPSSFHIQVIRILGSAMNGVFCIYDCDRHTKAALWNPATSDVNVIPPGSAEYRGDFTTEIVLHGFGYDYVSDDYKVIQHVSYITFTENSDVIRGLFWEIYSLKSNSWKKCNFDMPVRDWITGSDVYVNGVCHWWGKVDEESSLVSFNLCNEEWLTTDSPIENVHDGDVDLVVLYGHVAMISNRKKTCFQRSILGEFGVKESWTRLFDIESLSCIDQPIGTSMKGNIFFRKKDGELAYIDLTTGFIQEIGIKGGKSWCQMVMYKKKMAMYKKNDRKFGEISM